VAIGCLLVKIFRIIESNPDQFIFPTAPLSAFVGTRLKSRRARCSFLIVIIITIIIMATFPSLQPNAKSTLVQAVEEHLNHVIATAVSVSRKCKRARLLSKETHHHQPHLVHTRLHASDIHLALQMHGYPRLFGHSSKVSSGENKESTVVSLKDVVQAETLLEPPSEIGSHYTWLAVDGQAVDPSVSGMSGPAIIAKSSSSNNNNNNTTSVAATTTATNTVSPTVALDDSASNVQIDRMIQSGLLSEELKLYYQRITTALEEQVIANLAVTTGIQEIVPFLVRFAVETLFATLATGHNEDLARTMIRILQSLLLNISLHLELQLHQIIPALVTACVAELSDHHRCKLDAAAALALMVRLYGDSYPTLAARITSVLAQAVLEPMMAMATETSATTTTTTTTTTPAKSRSAGRVYGGLVGLTALGAVGAFGHVVAQSWEMWDAECQQVALTAAVTSLEVRTVLGDRCVVHDTTSTNGYVYCFV
jgi:TAF6 C-terminal HEAT repeat domain